MDWGRFQPSRHGLTVRALNEQFLRAAQKHGVFSPEANRERAALGAYVDQQEGWADARRNGKGAQRRSR